MPLTDLDRAILDLERHHWKYQGAKETDALIRTGLTPTKYAAALNALISNPEAEAAEPQLVRRLQRRREAHRRRSPRRDGFEIAW